MNLIAPHTTSPAARSPRQRRRTRLGQTFGMLFLVGPAADLVHAGLPGPQTAAIAAVLALFLAFYLILLPPQPWLVARGQSAMVAALAAMWLLAAAALALGAPSSFAALFVYCVAAAGMLMNPRPGLAVIVSTGLAVGAGASAREGAASGVGTALTIVAIGLMMAAFGRKTAANRELELARDELAELAVSEERLRIARDLHDLLGHSLSLISLKSQLAERLVEQDPKAAAAEMADIQDVTRTALAEVREAVHGYRQPALSDALDRARSALATAGIRCTLDHEPGELPGETETVLAWAVREGATNVIRHSDARSCQIRVITEPDAVAVEISDDGRASGADAFGAGLAGLAERAARVRGSLEAGARSGGGYRLRLTVPRVA